MHFSIPDTQEFNADNGTTYMGYNIHINGLFHCTVRYKQLHSLHEQLKQQYPSLRLPYFPPKKILPLTSSQLEERRQQLEKYVQSIGQNSVLSNSDLVIEFLLQAQQETHCELQCDVPLDIYLMNGCRIPINVQSTERSDQVLEKVCSQVHLPGDLVKHFALYLIQVDGKPGEILVVKKLEDFESPYISHKALRTHHKIVLRKSYWDPIYDMELLLHKVGLELLYYQAQAEVHAGWVAAPANVLNRLRHFEENNQKREYMDLIREQRHYGFVYAGEGRGVWGTGEGHARILLGSQGVVLLTHDHREITFRVTRCKCWRITTLRNDETTATTNHNGHSENGIADQPQMELSFEYLVNKDKLQWVSIYSDRGMFMSVCLQSIVEELMKQKNYGGLLGNGQRSSTIYRGTCKRNSLTYLRRDGSSQIVTPSSSTDTLSSGNGDSNTITSPKDTFSFRRLSEKFASVSFKSGRDFVENEVFEEIGDDDL